MVEQGIQMAIQSSAVYHRMQRVFTLFEIVGITLQKALEGQLAPIQSISGTKGMIEYIICQDEDKIDILDSILAKNISFVDEKKALHAL